MYERSRTETWRSWHRVLPVWFFVAVVVLGGAWTAAAQAEAQDKAACPGGRPGPCCDPRANPTDQDQQGARKDCPPGDATGAPDVAGGAGARGHQRGADGSDDTLGDDDNDAGPGGPTFRSGSGSGRAAPAENEGSGGAGGAAAGGTGDGQGSEGPGAGATGGAPKTPGPVAVSSPGARTPTGAPSGASVLGRSASRGAPRASGAGTRAGAGQAPGSMARTGTHVGGLLALAMGLMVTGTSLRRAARARPIRPRPTRRRSARRRRRGRRPGPPPPSWSYVDQSSAARAIQKF